MDIKFEINAKSTEHHSNLTPISPFVHLSCTETTNCYEILGVKLIDSNYVNLRYSADSALESLELLSKLSQLDDETFKLLSKLKSECVEAQPSST